MSIDNTFIYIFLSLFVLSPLLLFFNKKLYLIFSLLLLIPIFISRDYGPDYYSYKDFFLDPDLTLEKLNQGEIEPFWIIFFKLNKIIFNSPEIGFLLIGLSSFLVRYKTVKILFSSNYYQAFSMSIYIFSDFFSRDLGQIRNGLAVSVIGLFAALFIKSKVNLKAIVLSFIGVLIHYQSILVISFIWFFEKTKFSLLQIKFKNLLMLLFLGLSLKIFIEPMINLLIKIPYIGNVAGVVLLYFKADHYSAKFLGDAARFPFFIILSTLVAIFSIVLNRNKYPRNIGILMNLQILAPFTYIFLIQSPILSSRVASTFTGLNHIFYPIIFYYISNRINKSKKQNVLITTIIVSLFLGFCSLIKYGIHYIK